MHEFCGVVVPADTTRETAQSVVEPLLAPFDSNENEQGWWDWWTIGGRWTGVWSKGYDPANDPANHEDGCFLCGGTGERPDIGDLDRLEYLVSAGGCNGCGGSGRGVKHPPDWRPFRGDVIPVDFLLSGVVVRGWTGEPDWTLRMPRRLLLPDGTSPCRDRWATADGEVTSHYRSGAGYSTVPEDEWARMARAALEPYRSQAIVAVDCHD